MHWSPKYLLVPSMHKHLHDYIHVRNNLRNVLSNQIFIGKLSKFCFFLKLPIFFISLFFYCLNAWFSYSFACFLKRQFEFSFFHSTNKLCSIKRIKWNDSRPWPASVKFSINYASKMEVLFIVFNKLWSKKEIVNVHQGGVTTKL